MKAKYALLVNIVISMLFHVPAKAESERSNSQAKTTPNFENPSLRVGEPFLSFLVRMRSWKSVLKVPVNRLRPVTKRKKV